ncbi:MAG: hypothetical protein HY754_13190 [Nitrospirae bacterium]|nr:hypothetical protein [Nitrospirota bacterium]
MTRLIIETDNNWAKMKIKGAIQTEVNLFKRVTDKIQHKLINFEQRYGKLDRESLYGKIDDMELIEWEGEIETLEKLQKRLKSLEEITFEYR